MKLIGAGFPRTGTTSTKVALEQLGFGPCYHFSTLFERPRDIEVWERVAEGKTVDWKTLFADSQSTVDWPVSIFYKQLMEVYPDAKVLLNARDPETWYESTLQTVYVASQMDLSAPRSPLLSRISRVINTIGWQEIFHRKFEDKSYAISIFEQYNQEVKNAVPPDRLLVWNVKDGWEPLCRFLGVEVPGTPFPRLNDEQEFRQRAIQGNPEGS